MATAKRPDVGKILGLRSYDAAAAKLRKAAAERMERDSAKLLAPLDVAGEYDFKRLLYTTLGGQLRALTLDDLRAFTASARKLGKRFKGGITARGVIDLSLAIDRERSNQQINTAVVVTAKAGVLHFVTNSGPDSDVPRHHVHVEFPTFKAMAALPVDAKKSARSMLDGPIKFSCDCGRARFWYDYIATVGGFKQGDQQPNYPKIRNPQLAGVACKHALRVMQSVMRDGMVTTKAAQMIAAAQKGSNAAVKTTAADAKEHLRKQVERAHHVRNRVETTDEKNQRQMSTPAGKLRAFEAAQKEAKRRMDAEVKKGRAALEDAFRRLSDVPMTKAMKDALMARLAAAQTVG